MMKGVYGFDVLMGLKMFLIPNTPVSEKQAKIYIAEYGRFVWGYSHLWMGTKEPIDDELREFIRKEIHPQSFSIEKIFSYIDYLSRHRRYCLTLNFQQKKSFLLQKLTQDFKNIKYSKA